MPDLGLLARRAALGDVVHGCVLGLDLTLAHTGCSLSEVRSGTERLSIHGM